MITTGKICLLHIIYILNSSGNLFSINYEKAHFLASTSWLKHLWKFVQHHHILLQDNAPPIQHFTNNDMCLMDIFIQGDLKRWEIININKCRKYLQVLTLGDIITGDGKTISLAVKRGQKPRNYTSNLH